MILTSSAVMGTTAGKAISKGLGVLESLWKQGWAGYKDFPQSYPHLDGVHVNHHSWRESGPVPLGLPIEGILERKDHPYYRLVKMLTKSKSPIATHLVEGSRVLKTTDGQKPVLHTFHQDRQYAQTEGQKFAPAPSQSFTFAHPLSLIDPDSLPNYLVPETNYMLPQQSAIFPPPQVLLQIPAFASSPSASVPMILMPPVHPAESQYQYPVASDPFLPFPADLEEDLDPMQTMLTINPLPVYAPIASHMPLARDTNPYDQAEVYEDDTEDIESSSSASPKSTLTEPPADPRSSSAILTTSKPSINETTTFSPSGDLLADEDRQPKR